MDPNNLFLQKAFVFVIKDKKQTIHFLYNMTDLEPNCQIRYPDINKPLFLQGLLGLYFNVCSEGRGIEDQVQYSVWENSGEEAKNWD